MNNLSKIKILIVDDDSDHRMLYRCYLENDHNYQYDIIEAENLKLALKLWENQSPDLVLLDYMLPDGNGLDFLKSLSNDNLVKLPIIMLTAQGNQKIAIEAMKLGASDYLSKLEINQFSLCLAVTQVCEKIILNRQILRSQQKEKIINDIALRIRQYLDLDTVLNQIVTEVKNFLEADRVIIYQFDLDFNGVIVAEAVNPPWKESLHQKIADTCFYQNKDKTLYGDEVLVINDIYQANLSPCHLELLERFEVKANLVVPIILTQPNQISLWGLLIVHQCCTPRQWETLEIKLLQRLSVQLAIAVQQANLYHSLEQKVAERTIELENSKQSYLNLVSTSPVGIFRLDAQGKYIYANEKISAITGEIPEIGTRPNCHQILHPEDAQFVITKFAQCQQEHLSFKEQYRYLNSDGTIIWVYAQLFPEYDYQGNFIGYIGTLTDINEQKQAQQKLEQINQELEIKVQQRTQELLKINSLQEAILNSTIYSIVSTDVNGIIQSFNQGAQRMLGYLAEEVIGKCTPEIFHDPKEIIEKAQLLSVELNQTIEPNFEVFVAKSRHNILNQEEWTHISKNGLRFPVFLSITTITNELGEIIGFLGVGQYLSERKAAAKALQDSQARWQFALEGTGDGIWDWNLQTQEVFYSSNWKAMLGYQDHEIINHAREWINLIHPDEREYCLNYAQSYVRGDINVYELEHRLRCQDGSYKWILSRGKLIERTEDGQPLRLIGTHTDITERKAATKALQESQARWQFALEGTGDGVWDFNLQTLEKFYSTQWKQVLGYGENEIGTDNSDWRNLVHPEDLASCDSLFQQHLRGEIPIYQNEYRMRCKNGDYKWILSRGKIIEWAEDGQPLRVIGIITDISDRKMAELEREKLTQRLNLALASGLIGSWDWDMIKNVITWDQRMFQLYGLPSNHNHFMTEIKYQVWAKAVHPEDLECAENSVNLALSGKEKYNPEFRIIRPDGTIHHIKAYGEVVRDAQGNPQRMIGVNIDISDRKEAEALLQRTNQELMSATRLKDEFLANMSHELRTPLNAILGMTEALLEEIFGQINQKQKQFLETIDSSANHLLSLINDILDVAKIESGQIELERHPVNISALCQSSLTFIRQSALKKRIQVQVKIPFHLPALDGDERRLRQVLINLLNNAVKFTPQGGQITLKVSVINNLDDSNYLRLAIIDTGIGISSDNIKKLFKPFIQIDSSLSRQYEGTGLGLALVKNIVELHGGKVSVSSTEGQGSAFMIDLPYLTSEGISPSDPKINSSAGDYILDEETQIEISPLILLAEDNAANVMTVSSYLTAKGYNLIVARNGHEAIIMTQSQKPDLIIMDIQMPKMDGLEAIKYIRNQFKLTEIPIIALTALAMEGDREKCLAVGATEYLSKPVKLKNLVDMIEKLLKN